MEFSTEKERKAHPQASLIPSSIWWYSFSKKISKAEIDLMKSRPKKIRFSSMKWRSYTVCLCILYGYPKITAFEFLSLLDKKRSTLKYAMEAAAMTQRIDILRLISKRHQKDLKFLLESKNFDVVRTAARFGSFRIIEYVMKLYTGDPSTMLRAESYEVFFWACIRLHFKCKLFDYLVTLAPELEEEALSFRSFYLFKNAAEYGNSAVVQRFASGMPNKIEYMLSSENYEAFSAAASGGKINILKLLFSFIPEKVITVIRSDEYKLFRTAAEHGRINVIRYLFDLAPFELQNMLCSHSYWAFYVSLCRGHLLTYTFLLKKLTLEQSKEMMRAQFCQAFQEASEFGYEHVLLYMNKNSPSMMQQLITANDCAAFRKAAGRGQLRILRLLVKWAPDKTYEMVSADDFYAFRKAAYDGSLETLKYLIHLYPLVGRWMIYAREYEAFVNAAGRGSLHVLRYLVSKAPDSIPYMLGASKCEALRLAIAHSHYSVVKYLIQIAGSRARSMITMNDFRACSDIADVNILKLLISVVPEYQEQILSLNDFGIFCDAALFSRIDVLQYLVKIAPDKVPEMIASKGFRPFARAARINEDLEVLHYLIQWTPSKLEDMITVESLCSAAQSNTLIFEFVMKLAPEKIKELVCANNCKVLREALQEGNLPIIKLLFESAPEQISRMMELDKELLKILVSREHIAVLDFMLSCNSVLLFKEIFVHPERPYFGAYYWNEKAGTLKEDTLLHNLPMVFFENPAKLKTETQQQIICAFVTLGYLAIAKALMIKFWKNQYTFNFDLVIEVLICANSYPNRINDLLDFFVEFLHLNPDELIGLINRISSYISPLPFMDRFNQPRIDFSK